MRSKKIPGAQWTFTRYYGKEPDTGILPAYGESNDFAKWDKLSKTWRSRKHGNENSRRCYKNNPEAYSKIKISATKWRKEHPEYVSVRNHHRYIFNPKSSNHVNYKDMPFEDSWNPDKGGSFRVGSDWIVTNLGKRPEGRTLDIIQHDIGFVPGNLRWLTPSLQRRNQMRKVIANQRQEIMFLKQHISKLEQQVAT